MVADTSRLDHDAQRPAIRRRFLRLRQALADSLTATLRRDAEQALPDLYANTRELAQLGLTNFGEDAAAARLPAVCPYTPRSNLRTRGIREPTEPAESPEEGLPTLPRRLNAVVVLVQRSEQCVGLRARLFMFGFELRKSASATISRDELLAH